MDDMEGNRAQTHRRAASPGSWSAVLPHRDLRAAHVHEDHPPTWEISKPPVQAGTTQRSAKQAASGREKSERCRSSADAGEPTQWDPVERRAALE